jgi:hypothetical protein
MSNNEIALGDSARDRGKRGFNEIAALKLNDLIDGGDSIICLQVRRR